jgi:hypothetical protein
MVTTTIRHLLVRVVLTTAVLAAATGCGAPAQGTRRPGSGDQTPDSPVTFALPFDGYRLTDADQAMIRAAQLRQVKDCMTAHGVSWAASPPDLAVPEIGGNARRYGLIDKQTAQLYGYHVPRPPTDTKVSELTAEERIVLSGPDGTGGCEAEATTRLMAGVGTFDRGWFDTLDFDSVDGSAVAAEVREATTDWGRCMKTAGFTYNSPLAAIEDLRWDLDSPTASAEEIAVATTDVRCKEQTHLVAVRAAVETRIQRQSIAATPTRFATLKRANARIVENAQAMARPA